MKFNYFALIALLSMIGSAFAMEVPVVRTQIIRRNGRPVVMIIKYDSKGNVISRKVVNEESEYDSQAYGAERQKYNESFERPETGESLDK